MANNISWSLKPAVEFYVLDGLHTSISHRGRKIGEQANLEKLRTHCLWQAQGR